MTIICVFSWLFCFGDSGSGVFISVVVLFFYFIDLLLIYYNLWFCFYGFSLCIIVCVSVSVWISCVFHRLSFLFVYLFCHFINCFILSLSFYYHY